MLSGNGLAAVQQQEAVSRALGMALSWEPAEPAPVALGGNQFLLNGCVWTFVDEAGKPPGGELDLAAVAAYAAELQARLDRDVALG